MSIDTDRYVEIPAPRVIGAQNIPAPLDFNPFPPLGALVSNGAELKSDGKTLVSRSGNSL